MIYRHKENDCLLQDVHEHSLDEEITQLSVSGYETKI